VSVTFRYASLEEYPRISAFLDEHWAKDHIYVRSRALFDWTFTRTNHWNESGYSFALAEDGGEIVGILGGIPFDLNVFGKRSNGVWIVNYAVRPDHRKGSTALQLLSMFRRDAFPVVIACGLNPATTVIYRVLRGLVLPEMPRHFVVLPGAEERMVDLLCITYPEWPRGRALSVAGAFRLDSAQEGGAEAGDGVPLRWDEIDWPQIATQTVGPVRDADYLNWRYQKHPSFQYRFLSVADASRTGLAVWRLETIVSTTERGRDEVDRIGRLVEFLPSSTANARHLLRAFFQQLRACGALGADFYGYNGAGRALLAENGFAAIEVHPDGGMIPSRFQPLDGHGGAMLNAMFMRELLPTCSAAADCPWYWTKSDSDQDRPN
jgi:hypothetical protein